MLLVMELVAIEELDATSTVARLVGDTGILDLEGVG